MGQKLGIIAGQGVFSSFLCGQARKKGYFCVVACIRDAAPIEAEANADIFTWFGVSQILQIIPFFKKHGVDEIVLAGKIDPILIFNQSLLGSPILRILNLGKNKTPAEILHLAVDYLEKQGFNVLDPMLFIESLVCLPGILTEKKPSSKIREDMNFGWGIARKLADLEIGQTIVVKEKAVVAVEGMEGTDAAIKRGGELAGEDTVVIKVCRTHQDPRIDLPAVGIHTLNALVAAGSRALCLEAVKMPFFQKEESIALAEKHGISIIAKK